MAQASGNSQTQRDGDQEHVQRDPLPADPAPLPGGDARLGDRALGRAVVVMLLSLRIVRDRKMTIGRAR